MKTAESGRRSPEGRGDILIRDPRRKRIRRQRILGYMGMIAIIVCLAAWSNVILDLMRATYAADDSGHAASWTQAMLAVITIAVTSAILLGQIRGQAVSRIEEVDDQFHRSVATFVVMASHIVGKMKSEEDSGVVGQSNYVLERLREAPFFAFPDERALRLALSVVDHLEEASLRRDIGNRVLMGQLQAEGKSVRQCLITVEGLLGELRVVVSDWAPDDKGRSPAK